MARKRKVLILTADIGFGHRKAADALAAALEEKYPGRCEVLISSPVDDERAPGVLRDTQADYDRLVREMPEVYKLRYQLSDSPVPAAIMESAITVMLFKLLQEQLEQFQPDVVVATHPLYPAPLSAVIGVSEQNTPFLTLVTDLGEVHRLWFNPNTELCLAPTEVVREQGLETGLAEDQIVVTGIPVQPELVRREKSPEELRRELGWETQSAAGAPLTTALVVGSKRVKNLEKVLHVLNHSGLPLQLVVVAGGDDELYAEFRQTEWHGVAHVYNYVEDMPRFMQAADFIITKAGGLIVTESLACGLPMLLVDVTPGQEEGNAEYVVKNGAGEHAQDPLQALEILAHWLDRDGALLRERAEKAAQLGKPEAANTIADFVWSAAERGPLPSPETRLSRLPALRDLLAQFGLIGPASP